MSCNKKNCRDSRYIKNVTHITSSFKEFIIIFLQIYFNATVVGYQYKKKETQLRHYIQNFTLFLKKVIIFA